MLAWWKAMNALPMLKHREKTSTLAMAMAMAMAVPRAASVSQIMANQQPNDSGTLVCAHPSETSHSSFQWLRL